MVRTWGCSQVKEKILIKLALRRKVLGTYNRPFYKHLESYLGRFKQNYRKGAGKHDMGRKFRRSQKGTREE